MTETVQLGCIYSDSHKEVFGFRPRHMTPEQLASVEWLKNAIDRLGDFNEDGNLPDAVEKARRYDEANFDDGQPSEYEEYQDFYGGDDWDQGQYDGDFFSPDDF